MISTDFERLISPHNQACLAILLMLEQSHVTRSPLLPFSRIAIELEQLRAHLENLLLRLFVGLGLNFLSEVDNRFEMNIRFGLICGLRALWRTSISMCSFPDGIKLFL
jgi:hypothetical protein